MEALQRYHRYYGDDFRVECPTGSGRLVSLGDVAHEISERLGRRFRADAGSVRPCQGPERRFAGVMHWRDLVWFYEHFHGESGEGLGANHKTGWTALVARLFEDCARERGKPAAAVEASW